MKKKWNNNKPRERVDAMKAIAMMIKTRYAALWMWAILLVACQADKNSASSDQYTCPMHPTVITATQGSCPVCGMDLVRKARAGEEVVITEALTKRLQSPDESVIAEMRTIKPSYGRKPLSVTTNGVVTYDTRLVHTIPARVGGRLEKVYLRYAYQPVRKGQAVADIYSPEMLTAQQEFLFLLKSDGGNESLVQAAKQKLSLLGATTSQIENWATTGVASPRFTVYSPVDGYVIIPESAASAVSQPVTAASTDMGGDMNASTPTPAAMPASARTKELIRVGDYVTRGQTLFTIAGTQSMRLEFSVPTQQLGIIRVGDRMKVQWSAGGEREARVDFVQPFYDEGDVLQKIRTYVKEPSLRIGELVSARLLTESPEALWVPRNSITELGGAQAVFVKTRGVFKAREVETGIRTNGWIEIRGGLTSSDEIAEEAAFLVDSESFIKTDRSK